MEISLRFLVNGDLCQAEDGRFIFFKKGAPLVLINNKKQKFCFLEEASSQSPLDRNFQNRKTLFEKEWNFFEKTT